MEGVKEGRTKEVHFWGLPAPGPPEGGPPTAFLEASAVSYLCDRFFLSS